MAYLDHNEAFEHFKGRVVDGFKTHFPLKTKNRELRIDSIEVKDTLSPDDIRSQHAAKVSGQTWAVPVYAQISLFDTTGNKKIDSRRVRIAEIPKITNRYSYIVDGQEYQVDNQWQLKPGVYTRRMQNGELESRFNVANKQPFKVMLDPASKQFHMEYGKSKLPLYPVMKAMGVSDAELEHSWGKEVYAANKSARGAATALDRFAKSMSRAGMPTASDPASLMRETMLQSQLRPDATKMTLGKPLDKVTGEALHLATQKMLKVQSGAPEDDRDSLVFKDLRTVGDFAFDKLNASIRGVRLKALRKLPVASDVREVLRFDLLNEPIKSTFTQNSAARIASQINPVEMVSSAMQTTIMGPGGIQSEDRITPEAKFVNPTHLGFLDPINSPEGSKTGITLRLPMGVRKQGNDPVVTLYNLKARRMESVTPTTFYQSAVVLPDQVKWKNNKPVPVGKQVKASVGGDIKSVDAAKATYVMPYASQVFNLTSNLVPFLHNTSGNRASMAARHIEQSVSLLHRERPLVQVATGVAKAGIDTFENLLGAQSAHFADVGGVVKEVKKDAVIIQGTDGKKHEVQLYHNYPLNDAKSVLTSTALVKPGDKVTKGQLLADTNYSKGGTLALGTNLRVGYIPFKGYNFEDGVVISQSAADKLASTHLHKYSLPVDQKTVISTRKFQVEHPGAFTKEQYSKVGPEGVVSVGQRVEPGDPLVLAMTPYAVKDRSGAAAIRKSLSGAHTDRALRWESEHAGEVVAVHKGKDGYSVHVRTVEPMQVGDKIAGRYGNKGIVSYILPDHEMPKTKDGKPLEVALNPSGVPGRMNVGQVFETVASKLALKTGKPYVVQNFEPTDMINKIKAELKKHNISDTEEVVDPVTGQNVGKALVGHQYMLKLVHQVDKKTSVRSGMQGLPGLPGGEPYDLNLQPSSGSGTGGQSIGALGVYALLAHGARHNLREAQTFKSEGPDPQTLESKRWPSQHEQVWAAIQTGAPLPTPKTTFAFHKFQGYLKGAGINIEKKGHELMLSPLTDKHVLEMSHGAIPKPAELLMAKPDKNGDPKPKPGGLFDEKVTGGHGGKRWSHIALAEPVPNPVFEGPIKALTGIDQKTFDAIIAGQKGVTATGKLTDNLSGALTGGHAIKTLLQQVDVKSAIKTTTEQLNKAPTAQVDKLMKKVKYLRALDELGMRPDEAYVLHNLPVLPPAMRPVSVLPSGDYKYADVNGLYSSFAQVNDKLRDPVLVKNLPEARKGELRKEFYDGVRAIAGIGTTYDAATEKGLLHQIAGSSPKRGMFQRMLISKRQDLSMRTTIVPEPSLGLNEVGVPQQSALTLFRPFIVQQLVSMGASANPLEAQKRLAAVAKGKEDKSVLQALEKVVAERPVLVKRDPALHKHSIQAFFPKIVQGQAIQIHPLVTGGFNADFDGNCFIGSTNIVLKFNTEGGYKDLEEALRLLEESYAMKFAADTMCFISDGALVVEVRIDQVPHVPGTARLDKNGATVYDTPPGISVWSYDHAKSIGGFEPVTQVTVEADCDVAEVRTRGGYTVTASTNESLCVYDHETGDVRDVCPKDAVGRLCPTVQQVASPQQGVSDVDIGWVVGAFASDGFFSGANVIGHTKVSQEHRDAFFTGLKKMTGSVTRKTYTEVHGPDCAVAGESTKDHFRVSADIVNYFKTFYSDTPVDGRSTLRKKLPDLSGFTIDGLIGVLSGLLDGDGSLSLSHAKNKTQFLASFCTSSPGLVAGVKELGCRLGIRVGVTKSEPKEGRLQKHTSYVLTFSTVDLYKYLPLLRIYGESAKQAVQFAQCNPPAKDDRDIVPVPIAIMSAGASVSPQILSDSLTRVLQVAKSKRKPYPYVSRATAIEVLDHLKRLPSEKQLELGVEKWARLVASSARWDVVESFEALGKETVYDLCVPTTKVFAVNGGLVVWDTMSVFVPISKEAVQEAHRMLPTNNLFNEATGKVAYQPTLESALGLFKLSVMGKNTQHKFKTPEEAFAAVRAGKLTVNDTATIAGQRTTPGRQLLAAALPEQLRPKVLTNHEFVLNKKGLDSLLTDVAKKHKDAFGAVVDTLKDLGNGASFGAVPIPGSKMPGTLVGAKLSELLTGKTPNFKVEQVNDMFVPVGTHTLALSDFEPDRTTRDTVVKSTQKVVDNIYKSTSIPKGDKDRRAAHEWLLADAKIKGVHEATQKGKPDNLFTMYQAGVKPSWDQYKQMKLAPMVLKDSADRLIPTPVTKSYAEGLDVAGYWTGMHGARRGSVLKVQEVQEPGYMSKLLQNNMMHMLITKADCGTHKGVALPVGEKDVHDRVLMQDFQLGKEVIPKGTLLTPDIVSQIRSAKKDAQIVVRSPLKCEDPKGVCQKCAGLSAEGHFHPVGTNIGVISAHAVGERAVQLTLKSFHTGGTAEVGGGAKILNSFARFEQLTTLPEKLPNAATLAMTGGKVEKVEKDATGAKVWVNGVMHHVPKDSTGMPLHESLAHASALPGYVPWQPPKVGMQVVAGQHLSDPNRTLVNPHTLYKATKSIEKVQNHLTDEIYDLYKAEGVKRRTVEVMVKAMSSTAKVTDPGDDPTALRGEYRATSAVKRLNEDLIKAGKQPIKIEPILKGVQVAPLLMHDDWMAKLQHQKLRTTLQEAAATLSRSNIHGSHPIPALAYGAEFGLTKKDSLKPGMGHLKDVEDSNY